MSVTVTFLPHCQWTIVVSKLQGLRKCTPYILAPATIFPLHAWSNPYSWSSTQTVPFSNVCTSEFLIEFRIEFHSQTDKQHSVDPSNPLIYRFPTGSKPWPDYSTASPEQYVRMLLPHLDHLPSAYHIASFIQSPLPSSPLSGHIFWPLSFSREIYYLNHTT